MKPDPTQFTLEGVFKGFDVPLLQPMGVTQFVVTCETPLLEAGHVIWLREHKTLWEADLLKVPGIVQATAFVSLGDQGGIYRIDRHGKLGMVSDCKLKADVRMSGSLNLDAIQNDGVRKLFGGQLRKMLALQVIQGCPPPFPISPPPFAANVDDTFFLALRKTTERREASWIRNESDLKLLRSSATQNLIGLMVERAGAKFMGCDIPSDTGWYTSVKVKWPTATSHETRTKLQEVLSAIFHDRRWFCCFASKDFYAFNDMGPMVD